MANRNMSILEQNCRQGWPLGVCLFANLCGLTSAAIWFVVLFPQIWKNFRRKSVHGLSVLWACANFTASLVNGFFVFKVGELPLYVKLQAVYQPVLELVLLSQFIVYGRHLYPRKLRICFTVTCLLLWCAIIAVQFLLDVYQQLQWLAIALWSIETFPQVLLNMKLRSTRGQSTPSVVLSLVGKTTDYLSTYLLSIPLQYVIMAYFSSSMCFVNGLQVALYSREESLSTKEASPPPLLSSRAEERRAGSDISGGHTCMEYDTEDRQVEVEEPERRANQGQGGPVEQSEDGDSELRNRSSDVNYLSTLLSSREKGEKPECSSQQGDAGSTKHSEASGVWSSRDDKSGVYLDEYAREQSSWSGLSGEVDVHSYSQRTQEGRAASTRSDATSQRITHSTDCTDEQAPLLEGTVDNDAHMNPVQASTAFRVLRFTGVAYLICALILCIGGLVWNTRSLNALLAPFGIAVVLTLAQIYYASDQERLGQLTVGCRNSGYCSRPT